MAGYNIISLKLIITFLFNKKRIKFSRITLQKLNAFNYLYLNFFVLC